MIEDGMSKKVALVFFVYCVTNLDKMSKRYFIGKITFFYDIQNLFS